MTAPSRTRTEYPPEHLLAWTPRQREVLELLAKGRSNPQIAEALEVSLEGAKWHVREIMSKLGVDSREEAADYWRQRNGLPARLRRTAAGIFTGWSAKTAVAGAGVMVGVIGVAVLAFVLLNSGGDPAPVSPGETTTPPGDATMSPTPPPVPGGKIVVLADQAGSTNEAGLADVRITALGTGQGSSFTIEQAWTIPGGIQLLGEVVYATHHDRIARYPLDGVATETVVSAPAGSEVLGFSVSPDETKIAYWRSPAGFETVEQSAMTLVIQELGSGEVLAEVNDLEAFDAFGQHVGWQPGGESVLVNIGSSHDRGLRVVSLDGTVRPIVLDPNGGSFGGQGEVSPMLTTALYPVSSFGAGCPVEAKDDNVPPILKGIRDLQTNTDYWQVETDRVMAAAYGSPDGQTFLYAEVDCPGGEPGALRWQTVTTTDPAPQPVTEPIAVLRDWHGDSLVWGRCDGIAQLPQVATFGTQTVVYADLGPNSCPGTLELLAGDTVLGELDPNEPETVVLCFVERQP